MVDSTLIFLLLLVAVYVVGIWYQYRLLNQVEVIMDAVDYLISTHDSNNETETDLYENKPGEKSKKK